MRMRLTRTGTRREPELMMSTSEFDLRRTEAGVAAGEVDAEILGSAGKREALVDV